MSRTSTDAKFIPLRVAVITISDSRTPADDTSGDFLADSLQAEGHHLVQRQIVKDDRYVLRAEFSAQPFERGIVGMARANDPNSANSQFFIMFEPGYFLNGQYTVIGEVILGMDVVDQIKRGEDQNGAVIGRPDVMTKVVVAE